MCVRAFVRACVRVCAYMRAHMRTYVCVRLVNVLLSTTDCLKAWTCPNPSVGVSLQLNVISFQGSIPALVLHDATYLYLSILNQTLSQGKDHPNGTEFLQLATTQSFEGLYGH